MYTPDGNKMTTHEWNALETETNKYIRRAFANSSRELMPLMGKPDDNTWMKRTTKMELIYWWTLLNEVQT